MLIVLHILLVLAIGNAQIFETKTVGVGQNVTLTCTREKSWVSANLFWIRLVSGNFPEFIGGAFALGSDYVEGTHRIKAKMEPGAFVLHFPKTQLSDTAVYYCVKVLRTNLTFMKGIFLRIKEQEPDITAVTQAPPSDPVHPGDSVTLQCSVLSDSEKTTCSGDHSVYWFRAGSDESLPSLIYAQGYNSDECETSPEAHSLQKCVFNFFKDNITSSDAGSYHCAVATCGEILFGNGTKLDVEVVSTCDSQRDNTVLYLVCAALALSLIVIAFLIYAIRRKSCDCCNAAVTLQTNAATARDDWQSQQRNEDSLVYSTAIFTMSKAGKAARRSARNEKTIYTDVRPFVTDK